MSGARRAATMVVALGGNALIRAGERGTVEEQRANAARVAAAVADVRHAGGTVVLTHGNGPQVGNLAVQQDESAAHVPPLPLSTLVAMTQGQLGSLLGLALHAVGITGVVTVVTHVVVAADDEAFARPTKPIGPFFSRELAAQQAARHGWLIAEDAGRGWRRVVPSPQPREVVEAAAIRHLVATGAVVVAAGGGGVPVLRAGAMLQPVDGVVDKDLAAAVLATAVGATTLVLVTDVPAVCLDFGTPGARPVDQLTLAEARGYLAAAQFAIGSMAPKVTAATRFLASGGRLALITDASHVAAGLAGQHGTRIVRGDRVQAGQR